MQNSMNPAGKLWFQDKPQKSLFAFLLQKLQLDVRGEGGGLKFFVICPLEVPLSNNKSFVALCPDPGSDVLVSCDVGSRLFAPQTQSQPSVAASGAGTSEQCVTKAADKTYH